MFYFNRGGGGGGGGGVGGGWRGAECLWAWVKMFVKLSFYSMVYHLFVFIQFYVCFCPSVCLPVLVLSVYVSVRPCVRPSACMHIFCDIVCYSIGLYAFFPFVCQSDRPPVLSSSVSMNAFLYVCCLYTCP